MYYQFGTRREFNHVLGDLLVFVESHQVGFVVAKDARFVRWLAKSLDQDFTVFSACVMEPNQKKI